MNLDQAKADHCARLSSCNGVYEKDRVKKEIKRIKREKDGESNRTDLERERERERRETKWRTKSAKAAF